MLTSRLAMAAVLVAAAAACRETPTTVDPARARAPAMSVSATPAEQAALGKLIFFDQRLSLNSNQSCASCHDPLAGWTGGRSAVNAGGAVYEGSIPGEFGNRKPPSSAYATQSPILHLATGKQGDLFVGGNFWDGRATGEVLGNPAADQAKGPFLNPKEQAIASAADVVGLVCSGPYAASFTSVWGAEVCQPGNVSAAYDDIALSIAAYEASSESNAFSSKFDAWRAKRTNLSGEEHLGLALFQGKAKCAACHVLDGGPQGNALFTDYTYDNVGVPKNPANPFYATDPSFVDAGLGGFLQSVGGDYASYAAANMGKQKVPTLRNVDRRPSAALVKAYGHNGYFKSLEGIVHFYNTRDVKPVCPGAYTEAQALAADCWPAPEVSANLNRSEMGNLRLSAREEQAIVAFLKTLSDGWQP